MNSINKLRKMALPLALGGAAMTVGGVMLTGAMFTDSAPVGANTLSTGTVILEANPTTAALTASGMIPGDSVVAPVTVSNAGSLESRYSLESSLTGNLNGLQLSVKTGVTSCTKAGFDGSGTVLYGPGTMGVPGGAAQALVGSKASGQQAGDRVLAAGGEEVLCLKVQLPADADNSASGKSSTASFIFNSEQTANN